MLACTTVTREEAIKRGLWRSQSVGLDVWRRVHGCQREISRNEGQCECEHAWMCHETVHCVDRKEIRELGMSLVINARKRPPPLHLYRALLMAQVKPTSLHAHATTIQDQHYLHPTIHAHAHPHTSSDIKRCPTCTFLILMPGLLTVCLNLLIVSSLCKFLISY